MSLFPFTLCNFLYNSFFTGFCIFLSLVLFLYCWLQVSLFLLFSLFFHLLVYICSMCLDHPWSSVSYFLIHSISISDLLWWSFPCWQGRIPHFMLFWITEAGWYILRWELWSPLSICNHSSDQWTVLFWDLNTFSLVLIVGAKHSWNWAAVTCVWFLNYFC